MADGPLDARPGKINGLERATRGRGRRARIPSSAHIPLLAAGVGLYAAAMAFPLLLRQVTVAIAAAAILGTMLLVAGLYVRRKLRATTR